MTVKVCTRANDVTNGVYAKFDAKRTVGSRDIAFSKRIANAAVERRLLSRLGNRLMGS